jgi:tetratricopeptide (TPR) repeat protein
MKLKMAELLAENGEPQSIQYCDEVLAEQPNLKSALLQKSLCLQQLGDFQKALETYKLALAEYVVRNPSERNNLAYFRALANRELMMAATDIEKAIDEVEQSRWPSGLYLPLTVKANMANGVVSRHLESQDKAIPILSRQIEDLESDYARMQNLISLTVFAQIQTEFPLQGKTEQETHLARNNQDLLRGCLASLLTVRALLFQDLDRSELANADRIRVRELGFDADLLASQLPARYYCLELLNTAMTFLDTRGYVLGLLPWDDTGFASRNVSRSDPRFRVSSYEESLEDLDFAVASAATYKLALESPVSNRPDLSVEEANAQRKATRRTEAVILYHRMLVHERKGDPTAADRDRKRIQSLGFEAGPDLF